jgi:peptidyl-prolyl cis-trans isomerase B (cyclophilin B)
VASNKRERELARMRAERQAARRAATRAARQKRRNTLIAVLSALAVVAVVVVIAVTTKDDTPKPTASPSPSASAGACGYTKAGTASKKVDGLPSADGPSVKAPTPVTLTTNRGEIVLSLDAAKAPCTTNSFTFLAAQKYFDSTSCHRLTTAGIFVLQCGDPSASGSGGPGYQFGEENLTAFGAANASGQVVYPRGTIAMANAGPGTNGSQFFLVYKDSPLAPSYTPFGTITKGLDLLDAVAKAGSTPVSDGKPNQSVTLTKVTG